MKPAIKTTGQQNWSYRPGYKNKPRVEGKIQPQKFRLFGWLRRG